MKEIIISEKDLCILLRKKVVTIEGFKIKFDVQLTKKEFDVVSDDE